MGNQTLTHLEYCTYCPKMCRHTCPVSEATGRETFIPQNKQQRLSQLRKGKQDFTVESTEPLWACTGCRACVNACVHGVEVGPTLFAGRAEAAKRNVVPPELERYGERFRNRDERLGQGWRQCDRERNQQPKAHPEDAADRKGHETRSSPLIAST